MNSEQETNRRDDEISLIELGVVLYRRKWVVLAVMALTLTAGLAYTLTSEERYLFRTTVELASPGGGDPVESPMAVKELLNQTMILQARDQLRRQHDDPAFYTPPRAEARVQEESRRQVQIDSEGPQRQEAEITTLHRYLVETLQEEHNPWVVQRRAQLEQEQQDLKARLERLGPEKERLAEQVEELLRRLAAAEGLEDAAAREANDESRAMTQLLIQTKMEDSRTRLARLEETLHMTLPQQAEEWQHELIRVKHRLERIIPTEARILALPAERLGAGRTMILAISLVLGGLLGVIGAFLLELARKTGAALNR